MSSKKVSDELANANTNTSINMNSSTDNSNKSDLKTTDSDYEFYECPTGTIEIFRIGVYTTSQWNEVEN